MAVEKVSPAIYQDLPKPVTRTKTETGQEFNAATVSISEIPGTSRGASGNQASSEYNDGKGTGKDGMASEQQIKDAISKANSKLKMHRTRCEFSYHEETKRVSIKVLDEDTEEVIREIPPEQTLEMVEKMWELAGLLVDEKR